MNLPEFKAWFAGITATMGPMPTLEQWTLIKKEIQSIGEPPRAILNGPFIAQGDKVKKEEAPIPGDIFRKAIDDLQKETDKIKKGIPGMPGGWPSKQIDPRPTWPYGIDGDKYTLGGSDFKDKLDDTMIFFFNPRSQT